MGKQPKTRPHHLIAGGSDDLTKREFFAATILAGLIGPGDDVTPLIASAAIAGADVLIDELNADYPTKEVPEPVVSASRAAIAAEVAAAPAEPTPAHVEPTEDASSSSEESQ
jgi:hypothetical protein